MTTKRKTNRAKTDAEMGRLIRQHLRSFAAPFCQSENYIQGVDDARNQCAAWLVTEAKAKSFARLANRMTREDRKEKRK
jgi:hypothetical protein